MHSAMVKFRGFIVKLSIERIDKSVFDNRLEYDLIIV